MCTREFMHVCVCVCVCVQRKKKVNHNVECKVVVDHGSVDHDG